MAGSYMDAPAMRMAYDRDGSVGISVTASGVLTQIPASSLQLLNDESERIYSAVASTRSVIIVFPIPVDLRAIFLSNQTTVTTEIATSRDTTTGLDGTWTTQFGATTYNKPVAPNYRMASELLMLPSMSANLGVRGVRLLGPSNNITQLSALHLYGNPSSSATPDRIAAWHPTLDQPVSPSYFDWGNVARSSSADRTFRIKNLSNNLTANDIDVYVEALNPGVPSLAGMHTLSDNGGASFLPGLVIPKLDPVQISPVMTLRRNIPNNAQVSVWSARVAADVREWTT